MVNIHNADRDTDGDYDEIPDASGALVERLYLRAALEMAHARAGPKPKDSSSGSSSSSRRNCASNSVTVVRGST